MKGMDMELHELATKYQMLMGEMKTDIEAIKLGSIRRGLITVVLTAMFLSAIFWGPHITHRVKSRRQGKQKMEEGEEEEVVLSGPDGEEVDVDVEPVGGRPSDSGSELADQHIATSGSPLSSSPGTAYRDYSHLNIQYRPAAIKRPNGVGPDDWFVDSAYSDNSSRQPIDEEDDDDVDQ
ncbi:hypothetical protein GGI21_006669 [Coemansia aciculifera]|nr:hypothetical protein GGI21_006669 [Coemansia aciculifera]